MIISELFTLSLSQTSKRLISCIIAIFALLLVVGLAVILFVYPFERPIPYVLGLFLGSLVATLKVILLERTINRAMDMDAKGAQNFSQLQYLMRYILTGAVLVVAALVPQISMIAAIVGVLTLQPAAYIVNAFLKKEAVK